MKIVWRVSEVSKRPYRSFEFRSWPYASFGHPDGRGRFDKEPKELWKKGTVYQDGKVNELFKIYWHGYALGKCATK
jgi:hypothetical protein